MTSRPHKATLRHTLRQRRRALAGGEVATGSRRIAEHLAGLLPRNATVGSFAGHRGEPQLQGLLEAQRPDLRIAYPVTDVLQRTLTFMLPHGTLRPTPPWGIEEPLDGTPIDLHALDVLLVPGLGFGPQGERLGQGGGFYDRILPHLGNDTVTLGVGWQWQCLVALPTEPHDSRVMFVITEENTNRVPTFPRREGLGTP